MKISSISLCAILFILAVLSLFAQTAETGAIVGTVTDSSGAVIPGATVQATNPDTGQTRTVTTGADGNYRFSLLPPAPYTVRFSANGFKVSEVTRVLVSVTETPTLDQKLELGAQSEQVTVEANAEAIQTSSATLGTVIGGSQVTALPLTSRNYTNILALSAGVGASVTNASQLGKGGLDFNVNGGTLSSNNIQIDGANVQSENGNESNTDQYQAYGTVPVPNPDALQEFKIQTSLYDAGYGRKSGANINVLTKTGTNVFHGSAFEFLRNTALNANDFFLNRAGRAKGVLNQNQFGGSVGGPIRQNKLFFFASYQGTTQKNGISQYGNTSLNMPPIPAGDRSNTAAFTQAMGAGYCPQNHPGSTLYNTFRGGVQVTCDGSTINPIAIRMLQYKLPDGSYYMLGSTTGQFQSTNLTFPANYREDQGLGNLDYIISEKHTLALKFFDSYSPSTLPVSTNTLPGYAQFVFYDQKTALAKVTSILSPTLVNDARISYHRDISDVPGNGGTANNSTFGITPLSPALDAKYKGYLTDFQVSGAYQFGAVSISTFDFSAAHAFQAADQISWTKGKHTIRAGVDLEQGRWFRDYSGPGVGTLAVQSFADFLVGRPGCTPGDTACTPNTPTITNGQPNNGTQYSNMGQTNQNTDTIGAAGNKHSYRFWTNDAFINDDFKVSQRLTVNLGVRYEFAGWLHDILGNWTQVWDSAILKVPVPGNSVATGTLAGWVVPSNYQGPMVAGLTKASNTQSLESGPGSWNFAPRIGFAWQPFGGNKFVVRGGYGLFYDRPVGVNVVTSGNNAPPLAPTNFFSGPSGYFSSLQQPFRIQSPGEFPYRWVDLTISATAGIGPRVITANPKEPRAQNYSFNIQYNFLPTWVLEAGYVGTHANYTYGGYDANGARIASPTAGIWGITTNTVANAPVRVPYLGFGVWAFNCTCNSTKFNSLQVTLRKQMSHGLQAQFAYTFNKQMDTSNTPNYLGEPVAQYGASGRPQRLIISYSWSVPSGNMKGVVGKLVSGWNVAGVTTIQTGSRLSITDGRGGTIYNQTTGRAQILGSKTYADIPTSGSIGSRLGGASGGCGYFTSPTNASTLNGVTCGSMSPFTTLPAYVAPGGIVTNGTGQGNMGLGVILGPGQLSFDATVSKSTQVGGIHEDALLQFRAEFFNMFNHPQFGNPASVVSAGTFGQISSTTVNPRVIQLALKYVF